MELVISTISQGERKLQAIEENQIIQDILRLWSETKAERRDREEKWFKYFEAYYMRDIIPPPKWNWMSTLTPPKPFYITEQFVGIMRKSLLQSKEFFKISSLSPNFAQLATTLQRIVDFYIHSYNFFDEFERSLRFGAITGEIILKIFWKYEIKKIAGRVIMYQYPCFQAINPFDIIVDPIQNRYAIERYYLPLEDALTLQEYNIWEKFPLEPIPSSSEKDLEDLVQKSYRGLTRKEGLVEVKEFWGTLPSVSKIYENLHIILVNDKYVAKAETFNFFDNEIPFIFTSLFEPSLGKWGYGLFDVIYDLLKSYTHIIRYIENSAIVSMGDIIEIDRTRVDTDVLKELRDKGLEPFMLIAKTGPDPIFARVSPANFNPNILPVLQLLNMEIQNATGMTEFLMGLPTSKGRPTATEISLKLQQNLAMLDTITMKIEKKIISKIIRKLMHLIIQFESDEKLRMILGDLAFRYITQFNREEIAQMIEEKLAISVSGISEVIHRQEKLSKIFEFLQIIANLPATQDINWNYFIAKISEMMDLLPEEVFSPPTEQITRMKREALSSFIAVFLSLPADSQKNVLGLLKLGIPPEVLIEAVGKFPRLFEEIKKGEGEQT